MIDISVFKHMFDNNVERGKLLKLNIVLLNKNFYKHFYLYCMVKIDELGIKLLENKINSISKSKIYSSLSYMPVALI